MAAAARAAAVGKAARGSGSYHSEEDYPEEVEGGGYRGKLAPAHARTQSHSVGSAVEARKPGRPSTIAEDGGAGGRVGEAADASASTAADGAVVLPARRRWAIVRGGATLVRLLHELRRLEAAGKKRPGRLAQPKDAFEKALQAYAEGKTTLSAVRLACASSVQPEECRPVPRTTDSNRSQKSEESARGPVATRDWIYETLANPEFSSLAYFFSIVILILICISSTTFCLETMKEFQGDETKEVFYVLELIAIVIFTVEYGGKFVCVRKRWEFFKGAMNLVDFVAIMPFYLQLILGGIMGGGSNTRILRIIRLVRVFRVLKLGGRMSKLQVVGSAVYSSLDILGMLAFLLLLSLVLFSAMIYFCENGEQELAWGEDPFRSIPSSFWWCMVTLMTVGYGEVVPKTHLGQAVASLTMVASIIIMALPISVIGANFTTEWLQFKTLASNRLQKATIGPRLDKLEGGIKQHNYVLQTLMEQIKEAEARVHHLVNECNSKTAVAEMTDSGHVGKETTDVVKALYESEQSLDHLSELFQFYGLLSSPDFSSCLDAMVVKHNRLEAAIIRGMNLDTDLEAVLQEYDALAAQEDEEREAIRNGKTVPGGEESPENKPPARWRLSTWSSD